MAANDSTRAQIDYNAAAAAQRRHEETIRLGCVQAALELRTGGGTQLPQMLANAEAIRRWVAGTADD